MQLIHKIVPFNTTVGSMIAMILVTVLVFLLVACGGTNVVNGITLVVDAAEVALPVVAATTGVDPAIITAAENYLAAVSDAVAQSEPILNDPTMSAAVKSAKLTALFSGLAAANLPPGTPQVIVNALSKVAQKIADFLASQAAKSSAKKLKPGETPEPMILSQADQAKLSKAVQRAKAIKAKISHK